MSAYLFKSPLVQYEDSVAREMLRQYALGTDEPLVTAAGYPDN